jgi:hypothetical protein
MGRRGFSRLIVAAALAAGCANGAPPQALAPKIDQLFRTRLAELGATAEAVGIVLDGEARRSRVSSSLRAGNA